MTSKINDLATLIKELSPQLAKEEFVFHTLVDGTYGDLADATPIASFQEKEGLSLIVPLSGATKMNLPFHETYRKITLEVHSALCAIGLTKTVSEVLTNASIPCNVVAANHHDHLFVPTQRAEEALAILQSLSNEYN